MAFSDEQLKQWKADPNHQGVHTCNGRCALIRRLEAAEMVTHMMPWFIDVNPTLGGGNLHVYDAAHAYQQWRKACGR